VDLNYLLSRHQISMMRADAATTREAGLAHRAFAKEYAARIAAHQERVGAGLILQRLA
jgi:hypothetical protein